jgi:hypothetical protein
MDHYRTRASFVSEERPVEGLLKQEAAAYERDEDPRFSTLRRSSAYLEYRQLGRPY